MEEKLMMQRGYLLKKNQEEGDLLYLSTLPLIVKL